MAYEIKLVDYSALRKFLKPVNIFLFGVVLVFLPVYVVSLFSEKEIWQYIVIGSFAVTFIIILMYYLLLLSASFHQKNLLVSNNNIIVAGKKYNLDDYCLDLNIRNVDLTKIENEDEFLDKIWEAYEKGDILKFGNYFIHKNTRKKYEFKIPDYKRFRLLLQDLDVCLSPRKDFLDTSPVEYFKDLAETLCCMG